MSSLVIEVTLEMEERLRCLAERQGITVSDLVRNALEVLVAPEEASREPGSTSVARPIWEKLVEIANEVPEEGNASRPTDLAQRHDHYAYGTPKKR